MEIVGRLLLLLPLSQTSRRVCLVFKKVIIPLGHVWMNYSGTGPLSDLPMFRGACI